LRDRDTHSSEEVAMTWIIDTTPKRHLSTKLAAGIAISAMLALGTFAAPANAEESRGGYNDQNRNGGYYNAPPVVYGSPYGSSYYGSSPYYYPPPVVYGPGVGISLPFVNLNIR
jgi:hypothetical protein